MKSYTPTGGLSPRPIWVRHYLMLCVIMLSTAPAALLGEDNRNLGLIFFMQLSALLCSFVRVRGASILLLIFACSLYIGPLLFHTRDPRWSTVFYSVLFCCTFVTYQGLLRTRAMQLPEFATIIRYLIFAYAIVLIIQQFCVLLGFPILNVSNYTESKPWKLNALSAEPSHSARIIGVLMLTYLMCIQMMNRMSVMNMPSKGQNVALWSAFFWAMLTMVSATAVIMIAIVMLTYAQRRAVQYYIIAVLLAAVSLYILPDELVGRVRDLTSASLTLDPQQALSADHSGAMRVAPLLVMLQHVHVSSLAGLFGHGIDSTIDILAGEIWGVATITSGGGLLGLWHEYGFISFALFTLFTLVTTGALTSPAYFVIWFTVIFIARVNNQMVWLTIVLLYTLRFYHSECQRIARNER